MKIKWCKVKILKSQLEAQKLPQENIQLKTRNEVKKNKMAEETLNRKVILDRKP